MKKITAIICLAAILLCGCAGKEEAQTTTVTGIVTAVEGTQVTVMNFGGDASQRPQRQEGQEGNRPEGGFGGQMPNFQGGEMPTLPEGETMPDFGNFEGFNGQMPNFQNGEMPEGFDGQMPNFENGERPTMPEGETRPQGGGRGEGFEGNVETTTVDLKDAHITVEFDGGKATGAMEDIKQGVSVTITLTDGIATHVLVAESSGFGGFGNFGGGKWQGNFGGKQNNDQVPQSTQGAENA